MKILFVYYGRFLEATLPESIALLSAILKEKGHKISFFDTTFLKTKDEYNPEKFLLYKKTSYSLYDTVKNNKIVDINKEFQNSIYDFKPDLICASVMTTNYENTIDLIKKADIKCKVVFGGVHATLMPESIIKEPCIDFVCVGEGDNALPELCDNLEKGKNVDKIDNIFTKKTKNRLRPYTDLNKLPVPDLSIFDDRYFFRPFDGKLYRGVFMCASRGCPRGCNYCVNNKIRSIFKECGKKYLRFQSPEIIARNIKSFKKNFNIEWIRFSDDTFFMRNLNDITKLRNLIKPLNINFSCFADPATVTLEKTKLAKEMGCVAVGIGIETGSEKLRKEVLGRYISNKQIRKANKILQDNGIKVTVLNMIGLPKETKSDVYKTITLSKSLKPFSCNTYILYPFPGTKICTDAKIDFNKYKRIPSLGKEYLFKLSEMSKDDITFYRNTFNLFIKIPKKYWYKIEKRSKL